MQPQPQPPQMQMQSQMQPQQYPVRPRKTRSSRHYQSSSNNNVPGSFQGGNDKTGNWTVAQSDSATVSLGPGASVLVNSNGDEVTVTTAQSSSTYRNVNRIMLQLTRNLTTSGTM